MPDLTSCRHRVDSGYDRPLVAHSDLPYHPYDVAQDDRTTPPGDAHVPKMSQSMNIPRETIPTSPSLVRPSTVPPEVSCAPSAITTRSGRIITKPKRFGDYV